MNISKFQLVFIGIFAAFILIGVMFFAFGGRGSQGASANVVVWGTIPQATFIEVFGSSPLSKSKTITVTYVEKPLKTFDSEFVNALADGVGPDALILPHESLLKNKSKLLTIPFKSYTERTYRDTFAEEGELFLLPDGIIAFPISIDPLVMYWNRDIFSNAGLSEPPAYWDEFFNLSKVLTLKDGAFNLTRSTVALGEFGNITNAKDILSALFLQAGNPIVAMMDGKQVSVLREKFNLPTPPGQAALSFFTEFSNPSKAYYSWNRSLPDSQTMFLSGDLAVYFGLASEYKILKIKNPNLNFDIKVFPQSSNVRTGERKVTFGRMQGVAIVKNSKNIGAAFTVALELSNQNLSLGFVQVLSHSPARRDLLRLKPTDAILPVFYESSLWSKGWFDPDSKETEVIFKNMVESVTGGRSRLDSAIGQATLQIAELLNK